MRCVIEIVTVLAGLAILIGLLGIVIPVLPGSIMIGLAVLVWAIAVGGSVAWSVFAGVAVILGVGAASTYAIAAKRTRAAGVPSSSLVGAGVAGIVGFFVIPVVGLLVGFPLGLFGMEYLRLKDADAARSTAMTALKAVGLGMVIELGLALLAAGLWLVAVVFWT